MRHAGKRIARLVGVLLILTGPISWIALSPRASAPQFINPVLTPGKVVVADTNAFGGGGGVILVDPANGGAQSA